MGRRDKLLLAQIVQWILVGGVGCAGAAPSLGDDTVEPRGTVTAPALGQVFFGDTTQIQLHVEGLYENATTQLRVQVLGDPDDLASWRTITTLFADPASNAFAVDVGPFDVVRWPLGGVFRLRVVDEDGQPLFVDDDPEGVVAIVNPGAPPETRKYLIEKPVGTPDETALYYAAINAPATLTDFRARFGFPEKETIAIYYNQGDLGIGREMHCKPTSAVIGGGLACYVRNFGIFGGNREQAIAEVTTGDSPFATVAMVYTPPIDSPDAVQFMVYGANETLVTEAQLDTQGTNKGIPQNCLNCHGARSFYDSKTHTVFGAHFQPFDPASFAFARRDDLTFVAQEGRFRELDRLITEAAPTPGVSERVHGMFPSGKPYIADFVPPAWNRTPRDARVYREVVGVYCRNCHSTFDGGDKDPLSLEDADAVKENAEAVVARVCTKGPNGMPAAEATSRAFFHAPARAILLAWLNQPGACAP